MTAAWLTLKDMVDGGGCTARTVRYYEREGLLQASRTGGGHRLFAPEQLERLRFIITLRDADWTLDEVTQVLSMRDGATDDHIAARALEQLIAAHLDRLERKMETLSVLRDDLVRTRQLLIDCERCTVRDTVVACEGCDRVPDLVSLPSCFRLTWRARELGNEMHFDDEASCVEHE